jgi:hypothetical protein
VWQTIRGMVDNFRPTIYNFCLLLGYKMQYWVK